MACLCDHSETLKYLLQSKEIKDCVYDAKIMASICVNKGGLNIMSICAR